MEPSGKDVRDVKSNNGSVFPIIMEDEISNESKQDFNEPLLAINEMLEPEQFSGENLITINVAGLKYQTYEATLARYPSTLLGNPIKRAKYWNAHAREYFFDRHRTSFESILYIYQSSGMVTRPETVSIELFLKELLFFEMGREIMESFWCNEGYTKPKKVIMPQNDVQRHIWELMEYPDSSLLARILALLSVFVIVVSIASFCLETLPELKVGNISEENARIWSHPFFWIEFICIIWFTIEFLLRLICCPQKLIFMRSILNIIDFIAIAPFFVNLIWADTSKSGSSMSFAILRVLRLVRVFRIFKLSRHSVGLQILGKTFQASFQEFCLLIFFLLIAMVLFSSGVYFAEQNEPNTKFTSIPASFWFVLVTMTTVGYGDLTPTGLYGKLVGSMCALIGVLTLALPIPIIVANFKHFYRQETQLAQMKSSIEAKDDIEDFPVS